MSTDPLGSLFSRMRDAVEDPDSDEPDEPGDPTREIAVILQLGLQSSDLCDCSIRRF